MLPFVGKRQGFPLKVVAHKTASLEGEIFSQFITHKNWSFETGVSEKSLAKQNHRAGERVKLKDGSRKSSLSLLSTKAQ